MAREAKETAVAELVEGFRNATAAVLTEYRGLTVAEISALRRSLRGVASYAVVKNTLTRIAAREAGVEGIEDLLVGPSAIAFVTGDPVEAAKGLRDFAKTNPALVVKGGYMDGRVLDAGEIATLASLESREVLLAKLAGAMKASMSQAAALVAAPLAQAARVLGALEAKLAAEPSAAAAPAPAADPAPGGGDTAEADSADSGTAPDSGSDSTPDSTSDSTPDSTADSGTTPESSSEPEAAEGSTEG